VNGRLTGWTENPNALVLQSASSSSSLQLRMLFFDSVTRCFASQLPPTPARSPMPAGTSSLGTAKAKASQNVRADVDDLLPGPSRYDPEDSVFRAVEAAVRSAGGGPDSPPRPIGVGLPATAAGAEAAKVR